MDNRTRRLTHGEWDREGNLWKIGPKQRLTQGKWDREGNLWKIGPKEETHPWIMGRRRHPRNRGLYMDEKIK